MTFKTNCQRCGFDLPALAIAFVCLYGCTWCPSCAEGFGGICPNCQGRLAPRPRDPEQLGAPEPARPPPDEAARWRGALRTAAGPADGCC
jgi:hypothetical protein